MQILVSVGDLGMLKGNYMNVHIHTQTHTLIPMHIIKGKTKLFYECGCQNYFAHKDYYLVNFLL